MMRHVLRAVLAASLVAAIGLPAWTADVSTPAAGADKAEVTALHAAAQTCAGMVKDPYARTAALVRLAEVERAAGIGSPQMTLEAAEKAARVVGDEYHLALALCDVARARQAAGEDPAVLLGEAQVAGEQIRVEARLWGVVWDELKAVGMAYGQARVVAMTSPFMGPVPFFHPDLLRPEGVPLSTDYWVRFMEWQDADRATQIRLYFEAVLYQYSREYAAARKGREVQQRHLRDLARARVAIGLSAVTSSGALDEADRVEDPGLRANTLLSLAGLTASAGTPDALRLCDRALEVAGSLPTGDGRTRALSRAVGALLILAPERASAPLSRLREEITGTSDAALRCLMLGDLAVAAKTHDDALAAELYSEAVESLGHVGSANPFGALIAALAGAAPQVSPYFEELMERGYDLLRAGFAIDPARAAEACEIGFRLLETAGKMHGGIPSQAPLSYLQQWGLLRLLAAHDLGRELALTETSDSRLTRAWGLAAAAEAAMGSSPARAREYLDRAWAFTEEERKSVIDEIGVERNGELKIPSMREISRKGMPEQFHLLDLGFTLTQTVAAQSYLGTLTYRAGGDRVLALERCTHALEIAKMVPKHATSYQNSPAAMLLAQASGIVYAATTYVDRDAGKRTAAQLRDRLDASGRALAAMTAAKYLIPVDPISGLEFITEALENAPEQRMDIGIGQMLSDRSVVASFEPLRGYSAASVEDLARRVVSASKRRPAWMPDVARVLTEMTLIYSHAPAPR